MLVGSGWEESKLHEQPNQYIDSVCDFVAMLWCSLVNARKVPRGAIDNAWRFIVEGGFASLLDGFSRVTFCSTEGRALMSMDVACFANELRGRGIQERLQGHASSPPPPMVSSERGMSYVDTYIKIFYFPPMVRSFRDDDAEREGMFGSVKLMSLSPSAYHRMPWLGSRRIIHGISGIIWWP